MGEGIFNEAYIAYLQKNGTMECGYLAGFVPDEDQLERENKKLRDHINGADNCGGVVRGNKTRVLWEYCDDEFMSLTATGFGCDCGRFPVGTIEYRLEGEDVKGAEEAVEG